MADRSRTGHPRLTHRPSYRWVVLAAGFLTVFGAVGLGRFGYSVILPSMQEGLGINSAAAGALASWNFAGYVVMAAVGGILARRFGPRLVVGLGSLVAPLELVSGARLPQPGERLSLGRDFG